jgi:hypothetical protein
VAKVRRDGYLNLRGYPLGWLLELIGLRIPSDSVALSFCHLLGQDKCFEMVLSKDTPVFADNKLFGMLELDPSIAHNHIMSTDKCHVCLFDPECHAPSHCILVSKDKGFMLTSIRGTVTTDEQMSQLNCLLAICAVQCTVQKVYSDGDWMLYYSLFDSVEWMKQYIPAVARGDEPPLDKRMRKAIVALDEPSEVKPADVAVEVASEVKPAGEVEVASKVDRVIDLMEEESEVEPADAMEVASKVDSTVHIVETVFTTTEESDTDDTDLDVDAQPSERYQNRRRRRRLRHSASKRRRVSCR